MTAGHMYTVAGSQYGRFGQSANGTAAASTLLNEPEGVAVDASGLYIADTLNCRVDELAASNGTQWGISMTAGDMYHIAGSGVNSCGTGLDNILPTQSRLDQPTSVSLGNGSHAGDLYIADSGNNRIQEIPIAGGMEWGQNMTAGNVYTVAGDPGGSAGTSASGGSLGSSLLSDPVGVKVGGGNNLFIADPQNCRVMEAPWAGGTNWGIPMSAGDLYTVAGRDGPSNCGIGGDAKSSIQSDLDDPSGVWAGNGNLYIADTDNNRIQEVAGSAHTEFSQSMTADFVYTVAGKSSAAVGFSGDGGIADAALMDTPGAVWLDSSGNLWIADSINDRLREVNGSTADISTVAGNGGTMVTWGNGGPAVMGGLQDTSDVAADPNGDLFIADTDNNRVQEIAASTHTQFRIAMTAGDVYTVAGSAIGHFGTSGDGGAATSALLTSPEGVAADSAGNLYIADTGNNRIREVFAANGNISTIAGSASGAVGTSGDGGKASAALLDTPTSVAVDSSGNVYIADDSNNRVQEIADANGTQWGQSMTAGDIYTVAGSKTGAAGHSGDGGAAGSALLNSPAGVAVDPSGDLYIADQGNNVVREVAKTTHTQWAKAMAAGDIYTVAGNTSLGGGASGDTGPATSAALNSPSSVAVDPSGDLYIADTLNGRIQEVPASNGTQWSQSMTASHIYTVAGSAAGTPGESGDGGSAASAEMEQPDGMAIDNKGNLFTAGLSNVREIVSSGGTPFGVYPSNGTLGITITQPGGSQVTFYPKTNGTCTAPYVATNGGSYCTRPQNVQATLSQDSNPTPPTYAYSPAPGITYTYSSTGPLKSVADAAGDTLVISADPDAPGTGHCPSTASSCELVTAANGRVLVIGFNAAGFVASVIDPRGSTWVYAYNSASQMTSATDPMGNVTSYTYGTGSTGNPELVNDIVTITDPNAQPGGPAAGDATVNEFDPTGRVVAQTDPQGFTTTFDYSGFDVATGDGVVKTTDPDHNSMTDYYYEGTLRAQTASTGSAVTSEQDFGPQLTADASGGGTLLDAWTADGNPQVTKYTYDPAGNTVSTTDPLGAVATQWSTPLGEMSCSADAMASSPCSKQRPDRRR